eukprot:1156611-Pelagomonas_calceolata.AAC.3
MHFTLHHAGCYLLLTTIGFPFNADSHNISSLLAVSPCTTCGIVQDSEQWRQGRTTWTRPRAWAEQHTGLTFRQLGSYNTGQTKRPWVPQRGFEGQTTWVIQHGTDQAPMGTTTRVWRSDDMGRTTRVRPSAYGYYDAG